MTKLAKRVIAHVEWLIAQVTTPAFDASALKAVNLVCAHTIFARIVGTFVPFQLTSIAFESFWTQTAYLVESGIVQTCASIQTFTLQVAIL